MDKYKTVEQIRDDYQKAKEELWTLNVITLVRSEYGGITPSNSFWADRIHTYYEAGVDDRYAAREIAKELANRFG